MKLFSLRMTGNLSPAIPWIWQGGLGLRGKEVIEVPWTGEASVSRSSSVTCAEARGCKLFPVPPEAEGLPLWNALHMMRWVSQDACERRLRWPLNRALEEK